MVKINVGILYISLYNLLRRKVGKDSVIDRKEFFCHVGKHFLVPKNLKKVLLEELEKKELIKRLNRDKIKILDYDIDKEGNLQKILS